MSCSAPADNTAAFCRVFAVACALLGARELPAFLYKNWGTAAEEDHYQYFFESPVVPSGPLKDYMPVYKI